MIPTVDPWLLLFRLISDCSVVSDVIDWTEPILTLSSTCRSDWSLNFFKVFSENIKKITYGDLPFHLTNKMLSIIIASTEHFRWNRCRTWWWIVAWSWILGLLKLTNFRPLPEVTNVLSGRKWKKWTGSDPWTWCRRKSIFMTSIKLSLIHWLDSCI